MKFERVGEVLISVDEARDGCASRGGSSVDGVAAQRIILERAGSS